MRCVTCGAENAASRKFCRACGGALAPVCPACAAPNEADDRFCGECGARLDGGAPMEATDTVASPAPAPVGPEAAPSQPAPPAGAEDRRPVTVLFADLVGFTALSERLDAEDVREITTECFRRLVAEAARYEGTIDKFIGDAVMVLFGAPVAHEDDPARAMRAALAMQRALEAFNTELEPEWGLRLGLRIGVESGEVVAGVRDVGGVREYTVIGDAVNVAARLQTAADPDTILVGGATEQRTRGAFAFRAVPPLALKGKAQPVAASVLLGPQRVPGSGFRVPGYEPASPEPGTRNPEPLRRAPLVGRAEELHVLERCLEELRRGRGQVAAIIGEPGLGKSRLLAELRSRGEPAPDEPSESTDRSPLRWVRCQAFAHEQGLSYGLTRELVRGLGDLDPEAPEPVVAERLRARLQTLGCPGAYAALAHLLGLPLASDDARHIAGLPPQEVQHLTFGAVAELVERLARGGEAAAERGASSLVLELDDLHWADPTSIDLLLALLDVAERAPVFFCCAFRPERDAPAWALRERAARHLPHRYVEIVLRPLSEAASTELVAGLLHLDELPPGLRGVLERAAGTPLWVEELVRTLIERGLLVAEDGRWRVTANLDQVEIPDSLQALIVARIDRLGDARPTLQTASVIGRRFGRRVLQEVADGDPRLDEHLRQAQRADLVRELQVVPEREYGFKHVLTQEAAYATLLVRRRRELHRRVAQVLEELYADRLDELHPVLAHHYERAEAWTEALEHARRAGETARADYANREALEHYARALASAERAGLGPTERLELQEARAAVYEVQGQFEPAREDYEAALALAEEAADGPAKARLLGMLGMLWGGHKDYQRGLDLTRQAVAVAGAADDARALAEARVRVGVMRLNLAQMAESRRELEAALALFRELADEPGQAQTLDVLAMTTFCAGDIEPSVGYAREAVHRLGVLGDRSTQASSMNALALGLGYRGERAEAEDWFRRSREALVEMGSRSGEAYTHWSLAQVVEPFGAYDLALREASPGLAIARELDHREWTAGALSIVGRVRRVCGDVAGARRLHEEMLATARELGTALWIADALSELGLDVLAAGDESAAMALLTEAVATGAEARKFTARALLAQAELPLRRRRPAEALAAARPLQDTLSQFRVLVIDARRIEGEALAALGRADEAEAVLRRAKSEALALSAEPPRWRACLALGDLFGQTRRPDESAAEFAEARAVLEAVAASLSDPGLRRSFVESEPMRRTLTGPHPAQ